MTDIPNGPWFNCLPACETRVPCGRGRHVIRWDAGTIRLPEHPDIDGELVLAAFAGKKANCVELAESWSRRAQDLAVLAIGPRGPADEISVSWDDVEAAAQADQPGLLQPSSPQLTLATRVGAGRRMQEQMGDARLRRKDMLSLLALGYRFQVRLAGHVAAAHAAPLDDRATPPLTAAVAGRLAPAAEEWLGIDPDQVVVSLHQGPGWGSVELTGRGEERRLRVSLPAGWLARVWAAGLTLTSRHLVIAVDRGGWPDARVLGLRAPGMKPTLLDVHASEPGGPDAAEDAPHWEA